MQNYGLAAMCMAVLLLLHGCVAPRKDTAMSMAQLRSSYEELLSAPEENEKGDRIISRARAMLGTPYVMGGRNPGGFDCSGLVQWAYRHEGITLPRTAREQSQVGTRIMDVKSMRAGDIVAFRHPRRGYHTGIYVGDGKFIHSPRRRDRVKISSLDDPYFRTTFLGARRINAGAEGALARAESQLGESPSERLVEYREEQAVRDLRKSRRERSARQINAGKGRDRNGRAVSSNSRRKSTSDRVAARSGAPKKEQARSAGNKREKAAASQARKTASRQGASRQAVSRGKTGTQKARKETTSKASKKTTSRKTQAKKQTSKKPPS